MQYLLYVSFYIVTGVTLFALLKLRNYLKTVGSGDWMRFVCQMPVFFFTVAFMLASALWHASYFRAAFDTLGHSWLRLGFFCLPFLWFGLIAALFNRKFGR